MVVDPLRGLLEFGCYLTDRHFFCSEEVDDPSSSVIGHQLERVGVSDELERPQDLRFYTNS